MKRTLIISVLTLILSACENSSSAGKAKSESNQPLDTKLSEAAKEKTDRLISQKLRQAFLDDETLSENAKDIKIIAKDGTVILSGIVNSEEEKASAYNTAQSIPGVDHVNNQLQIIED